MDFTREPIIETVITAREGYRLLVRGVREGRGGEYSLDAVEVVSFHQALFFRSPERSQAFLLPVMEYEVVEVRALRSPLKVSSVDRAIKIGGGKEASQVPPVCDSTEEDGITVDEGSAQSSGSERFDKKRENNNRRRRGRRREPLEEQPQVAENKEEQAVPVMAAKEEMVPSFISKLFPPPPVLIKETLNRYKIMGEGDVGGEEGKPLLEDIVEELHKNPEDLISEDDTLVED